MFIDENLKMSIPDLSSPDVPPGEYTIMVTLTDGVEPVQSDVTVIIYAAPVFETEAPEETLDESLEETVEDESADETSEDGDTTESQASGSEGSEGSDSDEEEVRKVIDEENMSKEEIQEIQTEYKVFDWRAAFKKKEKKMKNNGQIFQITPPKPRLEFIH